MCKGAFTFGKQLLQNRIFLDQILHSLDKIPEECDTQLRIKESIVKICFFSEGKLKILQNLLKIGFGLEAFAEDF